jgi:nucleoside-diphosphate-sugar epimerase
MDCLCTASCIPSMPDMPMNILIVGARGFLGRHLAASLEARGHRVLRGARTLPAQGAHGGPVGSIPGWVQADFERDTAAADWLPRLQGVDAVVNAAGIFHERPGSSFECAHIKGPAALFEACAALGIARAVHISAIGADAHAQSPYHLSKREGDRAVLLIHPRVTVVQPSLVFGPDGDSSRVFLAMACLPVIPVPAGRQWVQPIHVADAVQALVVLLETIGHDGGRVALVGPSAVTWRAYLEALRKGMGLGPARFLPVPHALVELAAGLGGLLGSSLIDRHSWHMLRRGNTGDASAISALLDGPPRAPSAFVSGQAREPLRALARLSVLLPVLRWTLAMVWIVTAVVSAAVYPLQDSLALLARVGLQGDLARLMLFGAAGADLALGLATLCWPRRSLWWAQIGLIVFYTAVISIWLPEYWAHPYGPVLKNLPILGVLMLLLAFEERR